MKSRILAVGVCSLAMLFAVPQFGSAQPSGCAVASISIRTGTDTVAPGTTVGIAGGIRNCSDRKARYTLVVSALSSCGQKSDIASSRIALNPGENTIYSVSYPMPANTCAGLWEATVQVRDGNDRGGARESDSSAPLASASTTLMIQ